MENKKERKKIIIVGAGPGGLTTGMILSSRGYDVHIYEKESCVGGRSANIQKGPYSFDAGPTFLLMKSILDQSFELAGKKSEDYLNFKKLDPMYVLNYGEKKLSVSSDQDKMYEEIKRVFPGNEDGYLKFMEGEKKKFDNAYPCLEKDYSTFSSLISLRLLKALPYIDITKNVYQVASKYFKDELMRLSFTFQAKYLGMSPWECPGIFGILPYMEHANGIYHVEGGLSRISEKMAQVIKENGGNIHLNSPIKKVITEGREAKGILLESGEKIYGDAVVLNADFAYAASNLFDDGLLKKYSKEKLKKKSYSCSTYMLHLGVDKEYDEPHHQIVFADDYKKNLTDIFNKKTLSDDISVYIRNSSINDKTVAPEGHSSIYILVPVPNNEANIDWDNEKEGFRKKIFETLKQSTTFTDLEDHIIEEVVVTPKNWEVDFNVFFGATFNLSHKMSQMLYFRPRNRFEEISKCYLVGGGTHPGSGLPTIYESARISSNLIEKDLKD